LDGHTIRTCESPKAEAERGRRKKAKVAKAAEKERATVRPEEVNSDDLVFIIFDLETTGLSVQDDRIVQLAYAVVEDSIVVRRRSFVRMTSHPSALRVHGITPERTARGVDLAHALRELTKDLLWVEGDGGRPVLTAHQMHFDGSILARELARAQQEELQSGKSISNMCLPGELLCLDTLPFLRRVLPDLEDIRLETCYHYLTQKALKGAHDAGVDVRGLVAVLSDERVSCNLSDSSAYVKWLMYESKSRDSLPIVIGKRFSNLAWSTQMISLMTKWLRRSKERRAENQKTMKARLSPVRESCALEDRFSSQMSRSFEAGQRLGDGTSYERVVEGAGSSGKVVELLGRLLSGIANLHHIVYMDRWFLASYGDCLRSRRTAVVQHT
jgi:DNA polymerase III epsilon subunit-like protein